MNLYATPAALKQQVSLKPDFTDDDAILLEAVESASRDIDIWCDRQFFVSVGTRDFHPLASDLVVIDDLVSLTTLVTDTGDRTYSTTWASIDFDLEPLNAPQKSPPRPYTMLRRVSSGANAFPVIPRSVRIAGRWGHYDVRRRLTATVSGSQTSGDTTLEVSAVAEFQQGQTLWIGDEQVYVDAVDTALTVRRGVNGTTAASISGGAVIDLQVYPLVAQAALLQATRFYRRRDSALGIAGNPEFGVQRIPTLDPDVRRMLRRLRRTDL